MKTLYVSDLDGTLLHSDEKTSDYTNAVINSLVEDGMLLSYATARSYQTFQKVTRGIDAKIPVEELKEIATGAIESNNDDGVAKWLTVKLYKYRIPLYIKSRFACRGD